MTKRLLTGAALAAVALFAAAWAAAPIVAGQALMLKPYDPDKDDAADHDAAAPRFPRREGFKPGGYKGKAFKPGFGKASRGD